MEITFNPDWSLLLEPYHFIGLVFLAILLTFYAVTYKKALKGFKGEDGLWQYVEYAAALWCILFPGLVMSAIFGAQVDPHFIYGLDIVVVSLIAGKVYKETHEIKPPDVLKEK